MTTKASAIAPSSVVVKSIRAAGAQLSSRAPKVIVGAGGTGRLRGLLLVTLTVALPWVQILSATMDRGSTASVFPTNPESTCRP